MPCLFPISFDLLVTVSHGGRTASSLVLRLSFFFFFFFCMCLRISYEIGPISWFSFLCLNLYYPMGMGW